MVRRPQPRRAGRQRRARWRARKELRRRRHPRLADHDAARSATSRTRSSCIELARKNGHARSARSSSAARASTTSSRASSASTRASAPAPSRRRWPATSSTRCSSAATARCRSADGSGRVRSSDPRQLRGAGADHRVARSHAPRKRPNVPGHLAAAMAMKAKEPRRRRGAHARRGRPRRALRHLRAARHRARDNDPGVPPGFRLDFIDWSHSLAMSLVWAVLFGAIFFRRGIAVAAWCAIAVFSHFLCDLSMHPHDMALWPHSAAHVGFGIWTFHPPFWWFFELAFIAMCLRLLRRACSRSCIRSAAAPGGSSPSSPFSTSSIRRGSPRRSKAALQLLGLFGR